MVLSPNHSSRRGKGRKMNKGYIRGITYVGATFDFGEYGLKAMEGGRVTGNQMEAIRLVMARTLKKIGKWALRIFPHHELTKKAAETRMGGGKGSHSEWVSIVPPGRMLLELTDVPEDMAQMALASCAKKLSIKTKIVKRLI